MKKVILKISLVFLIFSILFSILTGALVYYAEKNIDYTTDKMLFEMAKGETVTTYYSYTDTGEAIEVWKSLNGPKKEWVSLYEINDFLIDGFISAEDRNFYKHNGVNFGRTILALINYIFKGNKRFGASTITQQVIKNISGDNDVSARRKFKEILRALRLEKEYSKDDILELYLNIVPMSDNMYGVSIASLRYFGKEPHNLSLAEAATIVGITNSPVRYNPYLNPEECKAKRNRVLYAMLKNQKITESEYEDAINSELAVSDNFSSYIRPSSWFIETAREDIISDLADLYGITHQAASLLINGADVYLTVNMRVQNILEHYFENTDNLSPSVENGLHYSMVVTDHQSGNLIGIIGNSGVKSGEKLYNYATNPITPASSLKPLSLYAPLLDSGRVIWSTTFEDGPIEYIGDEGNAYPKNSPDRYDGLIDLNTALMQSKNTVAVKLYRMQDKNDIFKTLKDDFGISTVTSSYLRSDGRVLTDLAEAPLALGQLTHGISLRKLTECYNVFPNEGVLSIGKSYFKVVASDGRILLKNLPKSKRVFDKGTAQIMNQMLMNVVSDGTAKQIKLKNYVDTAGKTGTSSGDKDRVFVGYTPYYTAGIWCGYANGSTSVGVNNPGHLQIWDNVMQKIHNETVFRGYTDDIQGFNTDELVWESYCQKSGCLITENCVYSDDDIKNGYFSKKYLPSEYCKYH